MDSLPQLHSSKDLGQEVNSRYGFANSASQLEGISGESYSTDTVFATSASQLEGLGEDSRYGFATSASQLEGLGEDSRYGLLPQLHNLRSR